MVEEVLDNFDTVFTSALFGLLIPASFSLQPATSISVTAFHMITGGTHPNAEGPPTRWPS